jgi:hypothetical protein
VKWTPNLAPFDAPFAPALNRGLILKSLPVSYAKFSPELLNGGLFWVSLSLLSLSLRVSLSRNEFIDHSPNIGHSPVSKARWPLTHYVPQFPSEEPDLDRPTMAILRSGRNAGKTKPHTKSFKELLHRIGQPTRLVPSGYADSTKLRTSFAWGRWTKYVDCFIHGPHLSS